MTSTRDFYYAIDTFTDSELDKLDVLKKNNPSQWYEIVEAKAKALLSEEDDSLARFRKKYNNLQNYITD